MFRTLFQERVLAATALPVAPRVRSRRPLSPAAGRSGAGALVPPPAARPASQGPVSYSKGTGSSASALRWPAGTAPARHHVLWIVSGVSGLCPAVRPRAARVVAFASENGCKRPNMVDKSARAALTNWTGNAWPAAARKIVSGAAGAGRPAA